MTYATAVHRWTKPNLRDGFNWNYAQSWLIAYNPILTKAYSHFDWVQRSAMAAVWMKIFKHTSVLKFNKPFREKVTSKIPCNCQQNDVLYVLLSVGNQNGILSLSVSSKTDFKSRDSYVKSCLEKSFIQVFVGEEWKKWTKERRGWGGGHGGERSRPQSEPGRKETKPNVLDEKGRFIKQGVI